MYNGTKYAVIMYHSFDTDTPVYLFDSYEKAKEYLHNLWQDYYNTELAESVVEINENETYHEDDFAQVQWMDGCYTQFILTYTSDPIKINGKEY